MKNTYLAIDLGGSSGRVIAGTIMGGALRLDEIHRFPNIQINKGNLLCWDFKALFSEIIKGLTMAAEKGYKINGIGIDTWGVDFGLIDGEGNLIGETVCYRDTRTNGQVEEVFKIIDRAEHYSSTGIQVMKINTLFQLYSMKGSAELNNAEKLLFTPDLFAYFLTGIAKNEYSISSTSELLDAQKREWSYELIRKLGIPEKLFNDISMPGTILGKLKPEIENATGLKDVEVITVASHDTASAVLAIPSVKKNTAFLSSGTWSLFGVEIDEPILSKEAEEACFTNEGGFGGKIRFLKNITGLWIFQSLMKQWKEKGLDYSYDSILEKAENSRFSSYIDVDDNSFLAPSDMESAIISYLKGKSLELPANHGDIVRCVLISLALKYKEAVNTINMILPSPIKKLHVIGGGSQNHLLNQLTADYLRIPVLAGPIEATAIGNILSQAYTKGEINSIEEIKKISLKSSNLIQFNPR